MSVVNDYSWPRIESKVEGQWKKCVLRKYLLRRPTSIDRWP